LRESAKEAIMKLFIPLAIALTVSACANTQRPAPSSTAAVAPRAEAPPQPSAEVRDAQQRLHTLGFYDHATDGLWGPDTRAAVERFQRSRGLAVTGRLDNATLSAIRSAESAPIALSDPTDVRTVQNRLRQLNFYNGPADGVWGPSTQVALESFQRSKGLQVGQLNGATVAAMGLDASAFPTRTSAAPPATMAGNTLDRGVVRGIQQRLRQFGFYRGTSDGIWGPRTQSALTSFQRSRGLEATGQLNPTTISALGLDPNNLAASASTVGR
jgi:peptidoglycan hydrolase-like protein with peptidoglycan-binding domain